MLPRKLSNGICSLNPKVDRLALSCFMIIDSKGKVIQHEIEETVIKTSERMTYTDVTKILENNDEELIKRYDYLVDDFKAMEELCLILREKRMRRGAVDFNFEESKIILNELGKPVDIKPYDRAIANRIIEEFMLACNETIAEHMYWTNLPFVYRIHEDPDEEKLEKFKEFIYNLGYVVRWGQETHPRALQDILEKVKGNWNFINKLWNASRFVLMNIEDLKTRTINKDELTLYDKWILTKKNELIKSTIKNMDKYDFHNVGAELYSFIWEDFCDWYIELTKSQMTETTKTILLDTLTDILKELEKPARDPRDEMPKPILRTDVLEMKDLTEGMILKGTVRNVIDFGAAVTINSCTFNYPGTKITAKIDAQGRVYDTVVEKFGTKDCRFEYVAFAAKTKEGIEYTKILKINLIKDGRFIN